jgi:hypothetical protein
MIATSIAVLLQLSTMVLTLEDKIISTVTYMSWSKKPGNHLLGTRAHHMGHDQATCTRSTGLMSTISGLGSSNSLRKAGWCFLFYRTIRCVGACL